MNTKGDDPFTVPYLTIGGGLVPPGFDPTDMQTPEGVLIAADYWFDAGNEAKAELLRMIGNSAARWSVAENQKE